MGQKEKGEEERNGTLTGRRGKWDSMCEDRRVGQYGVEEESGTVMEERRTVGQEESGTVGEERRTVECVK